MINIIMLEDNILSYLKSSYNMSVHAVFSKIDGGGHTSQQILKMKGHLKVVISVRNIELCSTKCYMQVFISYNELCIL